MPDIAAQARAAAVHCEAKKHAYRQTQDGVVVSFVLHPQDMPEGLATAPLGTRYMLALVQIGDDEKPIKGEEAPAQQTSSVAQPRPVEAMDKPRPGGRKFDELSPAQQAGILCNEPAFQRFMEEEFGTLPAGGCAEKVRIECHVGTRADIKPGTRAAELWSGIVSDYRAWQRAPEFVG